MNVCLNTKLKCLYHISTFAASRSIFGIFKILTNTFYNFAQDKNFKITFKVSMDFLLVRDPNEEDPLVGRIAQVTIRINIIIFYDCSVKRAFCQEFPLNKG